MIISLWWIQPCDKDNKFHKKAVHEMADAMFMFYATAGAFVFLVAILFGARAKRYSSGYSPSEGHTSSAHE